MNHIPISLYIHIPWCIKKCPYCDFNSHVARRDIPEKDYLNALICDFNHQTVYLQARQIQTVFIGGGTPSLMSPDFYQELLEKISPYLMPDAEITLEANPGTIDMTSNKFARYRAIGINRLSLGVQSLQDSKLKYLGRMHSSENARHAIIHAQDSGFDNLNCDLMFGLPDQKIDEALADLQGIIELKPTHISWYQLTIEPNTYFYRHPPTLLPDDYSYEMQLKGQQLLAAAHFAQYEVSAYAKQTRRCLHNLNYWEFGDYLGIGAGAHGKITLADNTITRTEHHKNPKIYRDTSTRVQQHTIATNQYVFEFMLNALRLTQPIPYALVEARCFIDRNTLLKSLATLQHKSLINCSKTQFQLTEKGSLFINDILIELLQPYCND